MAKSVNEQSAGRVAAGWHVMLAAAALYNLLIGGVALALGAGVDGRITGLLVGCFGLVYALAAREPVRFAPMLWVGVIGKLGVIALMLPLVRAGAAALGTGLVLLGDGLFTVGFIAFLLLHRHGKEEFLAHG